VQEEVNGVQSQNFPAKLKHLKHQSFPDAQNEFLRCQLGKRVHETRRLCGRGCGMGCSLHTLPVTLFHLIGYGGTWEAATQMAMQRLGLAAPSTEPGLTRILTGT
jgi:hypothetical protein